MDKAEIDKEYGHLWTKGYYVLAKSNDPVGYTIHDEEMGSFCLIENVEIIPYLIERMLESGTKVYESIRDLPVPQHPTKWTSMDEWINFVEVAKELALNADQAEDASRRAIGRKMSQDEIIEVIKSLNFDNNK